MATTNGLNRYLDAQMSAYSTALAEVTRGKKISHWMWYIFPQIKGLGMTETSRLYAIEDLKEASAYLAHPILGQRLLEISGELLKIKTNDPRHVFGSPDDMKLKSCMTLFASLDNANPVFTQVLDKFYGGAKDELTLKLIH